MIKYEYELDCHPADQQALIEKLTEVDQVVELHMITTPFMTLEDYMHIINPGYVDATEALGGDVTFAADREWLHAFERKWNKPTPFNRYGVRVYSIGSLELMHEVRSKR